MKQESVNVWMRNPQDIKYDVPCDGREQALPWENHFRDLLHQRDSIVKWTAEMDDSVFPYMGNTFAIFATADPIVIIRHRDAHGDSPFEEKNGLLLTYTGTNSGLEAEIKHNTKMILTPDFVSYMINQQLDPTVESHDQPPRTSSDIERRKQFILYAARQAIINVVRARAPGKSVYLNGNDVLVDGRKISGMNAITHLNQHHEHGSIIWNYDAEFFEAIMKGDHNHIASVKKRGRIILNREESTGSFTGITGIANEIPGYTREEFAVDFMNEVNRILDMAKSSELAPVE